MTDIRTRFRILRLMPLLVLAALWLAVAGCKTSKAGRGATDELPQALLWKIDGNGLQQPSYLFGTIHIIPKENFFYPDGLTEAFAGSERVVFEIDLNEMDDMSGMMNMLTGLMMKDGVTLSSLLSAGEYAEVSDYFEDLGLPMFLLSRVKPMFLSMLAQIDMDPAALGGEDMLSYEMELHEQAQEAGKSVGGLETMAYQMSLFDSIPYQEQAVMLLDAIRGTNAESDVFQETVDLYTQQHIEAMVALVENPGDGADPSGQYEQVLLHNRNHNWIPVMAGMMARERVFFAVGAGHLGGPQGVIRLLRKAGYTLTPVSVHKPGARRV